MIGWLIALGVLTLLAILPIGVSALYNTEGPLLRLILGPVRWTVYPSKKKKEKPKEEKPAKEKAAKTGRKKEPSEKGGSWKDFQPIVETVLTFLGEFRRKLRVQRLEMNLILGGDDACDLALSYGRAWAALGNLMPQLERLFVIKKRNLEVQCDFTANSTVIFARLDLTVSLGWFLVRVVKYGLPALNQYKELKNSKGGAKI